MNGAQFVRFLMGGSGSCETRKCSKCGSNVEPTSKWCPYCGSKMQPASSQNDLWSCEKCKTRDIPSPFCPGCGAPRPDGDGPWECPECGKGGLTSPFCPECGTGKPEKSEGPKTWICSNPKCKDGPELPMDYSICPFCGEPREGKPKPAAKCPHCGKEINPRFKFCPHCKKAVEGGDKS